MKKWLKAFRLRTLPLALSSIILGSMVAYAVNSHSWEITLLAITTTIFLQVLSNLANDYGDSVSGVDNDQRVGPTRSIQGGEITKSAMLRAMIICGALALVSGLTLIYLGLKDLSTNYLIGFLILGLIAIAAAVKYTVGKKPYGYMGLGDIFVFIFFGLVGVVGTYFLHTHHVDWEIILPASSVGFLSAAVLNLNNMRDRENDKASGKNTLVVKLGIEKAKIYHTTILVLAIVSAMVFTIINYNSPFQFIFMVSLFPIMLNLKTVWQHFNPQTLDPELKKIALTTLVFSITFGLGLIIDHA